MRSVFVTLLLAAAILITGSSPLMAGSDDVRATANKADSAWKDKNIETINTVRTLISDWANSWQEKDIDRYMSYYSLKFRSGGLDYSAWQDKKTRLFKKSGNLSLKVSDLGVVVEGDHASASFVQHYRDEQYTDIGEKTIQLVQEDGKWHITTEEWRPLNR
ncbi:MAG: hypothetical protein AB1427_15080 [Thermodesulfobacteriota bacterium]